MAAGLGAASVRVIVAGEGELVESTAALEAGDVREAIVRARRAAGWYAPGAPHVRVAYERLVALARAAEEHRRFDAALLAWRAVRTSAVETRWLVTPHADDLELAEREIARLAAGAERAPATRTDEPEAFAAEQLAALARAPGPRLGWSLALVGGFALAALGLVLVAREVAAPAERRGLRRFIGLAVGAAGVALWLLSWWRA
ncbi:MAG: hypothetical protein IT373_23940 [Polyangiaceae bacterium]|nr:hypothetical protein [Polyangiaceae bacterium]